MDPISLKPYRKVLRWLTSSVQAKIVIGTTLIVALVIGASTYFAIRFQEHQLLGTMRRRIHVATGTIARSITLAMEEGRAKDVRRILQLIGSSPHYLGLRIFSPQGVVLQASDTTQVGRKVISGEIPTPERTVVLFEDGHQQPKVMTARRAILNEPRCYRCHGSQAKINGILEISMPLTSIQSQIALSRKLMIGNALLTFLVMSAALSLLLTLLVGRPVQQLSETMAKVEAGNLNAHVRFKRRDEIGALGRSFNAMVRRIADMLRQLELHHQREMQRADRLATLGELAAGIAHEVRNPLAGISGAVQVLTSELADDDPRKDVMKEIQKEIDRLDGSLKTFLEYARPAKPELQLVDVHEVIDRTLNLCLQSAQCSGIEVVRRFDNDLPPMRIDPILMEQVFMNIIINALQAMDNSGRLTVITRRANDGIVRGDAADIVFEDTGGGIPEERLENIFRPFFSTKHQGTGLGLTIALRIVEQHGGTITVDSEVGKGTRFRVVVPMNQSVLQESASSSRSS
jgi:signal transduction histidine kinase